MHAFLFVYIKIILEVLDFASDNSNSIYIEYKTIKSQWFLNFINFNFLLKTKPQRIF